MTLRTDDNASRVTRWRATLLMLMASVLLPPDQAAAEVATERGFSGGGASTAADPDAAQQERLARQKLQLLEQLMESNSVDRLTRSGDPTIASRLAIIEGMIARVREDLAHGRMRGAAVQADTALRQLSGLARSVAADEDKSSQTKAEERFVDLLAEVEGYRHAISETVSRHGSSVMFGGVTGGIDRQVRRARAAARNDDYVTAVRLLNNASRDAVNTISRLRDKETVVYELRFDGPEDEYAYELDRHASHEMLVVMMLEERKVPATVRSRIAGQITKSRQLRARAEELAAQGAHADAVGVMEEAIKFLARALRQVGPQYPRVD